MEIVLSHSSSTSRGIAILLPGNMKYEILEKYKDSDGRFIIIKCKFENTNYIISNCYAPTQQHKIDQLNFIQLTRNYLCKFENENIIVAGDFNLYLSPKLDKSDSTYI